MSLCYRCLRRATIESTRSSRSASAVFPPVLRRAFTHSTISRNDDQTDELKRAKERAWYLDPSPAPSSSSSRTTTRPRFTTFDPESTRSDAPDPLSQEIMPLPAEATSSPLLVQLHDHLTKQSDSVDPTTVRFLHPASSKVLQEQSESLLGETGGTGWQWVVVAQVKGRGRGVVNRAEKEIRKWMREQLGRRTRSRTASRAESDTDWAMVHIGDGVCVNLFTADGRERWNLEELWAKAT